MVHLSSRSDSCFQYAPDHRFIYSRQCVKEVLFTDEKRSGVTKAGGGLDKSAMTVSQLANYLKVRIPN